MVTAPPATSLSSNPLSAFFGNTLITRDDGITAHFYYNEDHTFTGTVPAFQFALKGTWSLNDKGEVCRVFDPLPPTVHNPDCGMMMVHAVGEKKIDATGHGEKLVQGIQ